MLSFSHFFGCPSTISPSIRSVGRLFASTKEAIAEEIFTKHELSYIFATVIMNAFAQKHLLRGQLRVYPFISGFERFSPHQFHINNDFYIVFFSWLLLDCFLVFAYIFTLLFLEIGRLGRYFIDIEMVKNIVGKLFSTYFYA